MTSPLRSPRRRHALLALLALATPLVLGLLLQVDADHARLFGQSGPACPVGEALGSIWCPGCGLTRSTALILQGHWATATAVHPGGWVIVLLCTAGVLVHTDVLRRGAPTATHGRLLRLGRWIFLGGLAASWLWRIGP